MSSPDEKPDSYIQKTRFVIPISILVDLPESTSYKSIRQLLDISNDALA